MIRKISVQDVVSKHPKDDDSTRRERDFLIEKLTRRQPTPTPITKRRSQSKQSFDFRKFRPSNKILWMLSPFVVILIGIVLFQIFTVDAIVTVKPSQITVPIDVKLYASANATTTPNALMFQIITLSAEESSTVIATSTVASKPTKASGKITIFNKAGTASQTLVKNTRFETPNGLIYRIQNDVKVPGTSKVDGKIVPGSITVTVVADQAGSKYDINESDFTIPGFKTNSNKFTNIFGRSSTPITGGADENAFGVDPTLRKVAQEAIQTRLKSTLLKQAQAQKTANSVIFDSASKISFEHLADTASADGQQVTIHERGIISSVAFDRNLLGKMILGDAISAVGDSAEIRGMDTLRFATDTNSSASIWQPKPFYFTLSGAVDVVGIVDKDKLAKDLSGVARGDLNKILLTHPTVGKANAIIRPFWRGSFPANPASIKIEIAK